MCPRWILFFMLSLTVPISIHVQNVGAPGLAAFARPGNRYVRDSSDWWSIPRREEVPAAIPKIKPGNKPLAANNFEIAGVPLGQKQFAQLAKKFGRAEEIQRGDAASGREQVCYRSSEGFPVVHLIFEFDEVSANFYLFEGGADWSASDACRKSDLVSNALSTRSGLKLGIDRAQVESILGPPDAVKGDQLFYSREVKRRTTPEAFDQMRRDYPAKMSDSEAHQKFDYVDEGVRIEIHFQGSRLVFLAASKDIA